MTFIPASERLTTWNGSRVIVRRLSYPGLTNICSKFSTNIEIYHCQRVFHNAKLISLNGILDPLIKTSMQADFPKTLLGT